MTLNSNAPKLIGYVYSPDEARACRDRNEILSIRLETSLRCNLECRYCCNKASNHMTTELPFGTITSLVDQAKELHAKSIVVIGGGEPTIFRNFRPLIDYIYSKELVPVVFTNAQTMDIDLARFLFNRETSVIVKLDSLTAEKQDFLTGKCGSLNKIMAGIENLMSAGYEKVSGKNLRLGASFVISKYNMDDVPTLWRFCRDRNIFPNLEMLIPNGKAKQDFNQVPSLAEWKKIKSQLLDIDNSEYGFNWLPFTPIPAAGCSQCFYNVYITVFGQARPCSSIHFSQANVFQKKLKEIITTDEFFNNVPNANIKMYVLDAGEWLLQLQQTKEWNHLKLFVPLTLHVGNK